AKIRRRIVFSPQEDFSRQDAKSAKGRSRFENSEQQSSESEFRPLAILASWRESIPLSCYKLAQRDCGSYNRPAALKDPFMRIEKPRRITPTRRDGEHPSLTGAWTPQHEKVTAHVLPVLEGAVPADLDGVYLRNTENQIHEPLGRYHPFDGDGMIHQIDFRDGRASYRNRFVHTRCFATEQEAGRSLWGGLADPPRLSERPGFGAHGSLKDSSSTDIVVHAGRALSTFYQCGESYRLDPPTLQQHGVET